jgi:fructose-1,6-bisphosphatase/sedoheptulose 1,7-bisphosphatase-like protein
MGIGRGTRRVLAASALKTLGGQFCGRLIAKKIQTKTEKLTKTRHSRLIMSISFGRKIW